MKKLFLVDASNMFFRAYYAIRPLTNSKGLHTNALYGYLSMTIKLLREMKPDYIAYCFDSKEPGFRDELYEDYKANRTEMPDELAEQMPYFTELVEKLGIPIFAESGVEADDLIGTLACFGQSQKLDVTIISGDKDFAQIVGPGIQMFDTMKEITFDVEGVKAKWGIRPDQMIDYLALIGDSSDNIPGVAGVGPKTALKLLDQYQSLDEIYQNIDSVKPEKLQEKLRASKEMAYLSQNLVTIRTDIPLNISVEDLKPKPINRKELMDLLNELEFKTFERKIFGSNGSEQDSNKQSGENKQESLEQEKNDSPKDASNTRTASVSNQNLDHNLNSQEISVTAQELAQHLSVGATLWALPNNRGLFVADDKNIYILQDDLAHFTKLFNEKKISWKGFDLKNFWHSLKLKTPIAKWDHQVAAYVVEPEYVEDFNELYEELFQIKLPEFPTPHELLACHLQVEKKLQEELLKREGLKVYEDFDLPLIPVLYDMERIGILLDTEILKKQSEGLYQDIRKLELSIYEYAEEVFNIASPKQLAHILFEKLKLTPLRKTKTGYSTDADVLAKLEDAHPIASLISEYRELAKLKSTYVDALPIMVDQEKRIHTTFSQTVTSTGRLSSHNPNLQNIPIRTERGNAIRKAFIAHHGCHLISADYSQIELRVMAHITGDPGLVRAFENDLDIHAATAAEVFGVAIQDVTPDQRRIAKAVNFGLAYGMGAHGLAENLGISRGEASDIITKYFSKFAKVKIYMQEVIQVAKNRGYVATVFGRRRYTPDLKSSNARVRSFEERAVINAPMQGTASDIVKKAMIQIFQESPIKMPKSKMLLQIHDELIFEAPVECVEAYKKEICQIMENVVKLRVPLKVNVSSGPSWFDAHS